MKAKVVTVILTVAVAGSVFFNVKQYNEAKEIEVAIAETNEACLAQEAYNNDLESQITKAQAKLESLKSEVSALSEHIETATAERDALQCEVVDLQAKVDQKHKEEEEAARKAAEEAEAAKKAAATSKTSTTTASAGYETDYVMTQAEIDAAWDNFLSQCDASEVVYLSEEDYTTSAGGGSLSWIRCE